MRNIRVQHRFSLSSMRDSAYCLFNVTKRVFYYAYKNLIGG